MTAYGARPDHGISVIIPCYNHAQWLPLALASVLSQSVEDLQVIVVNDGSSDKSRDVALAYGSRITYVQQQNAGLSAARNRGLAEAKGAWLLFLDADDEMCPGSLSAFRAAMAAGPEADILCCRFQIVDAAGSPSGPIYGPDVPEDIFHRLIMRNIGPVHSMLARRGPVEAAGGFRVPVPACCEDWDLWLRLASAGARFRAVPDGLVSYRDLPSSMSKNAEKMWRAGRWVLKSAGSAHGWCEMCRAAYADYHTFAVEELAGKTLEGGKPLTFRAASGLIRFLARNPSAAAWYLRPRFHKLWGATRVAIGRARRRILGRPLD